MPGRVERLQLMDEIGKLTQSKVIVFLTGDRPGLETRIAQDSYSLLMKHLSGMGEQKTISLFLYTPGGDTMAASAISNLIRQYAESYYVLIPYKALSSGTLISLGANKIFMSRSGLLSPIDPSVNTPFGPRVQHPSNPNVMVTVPVNVEDVSGYHRLAKDEWAMKDDSSLSQAFNTLSGNVHPLALGAVHRAREQITFLSKSLLSSHMKDSSAIEKIVTTLTRERFTHGYLIGRKEAMHVLNLPIAELDTDLEDKIMKLYSYYERILELNSRYNQEAVLGDQEKGTAEFNRAVVESSFTTHVYRTKRLVQRVQSINPQTALPQEAYSERTLFEGWVEDKNV